MNLFLKDKVALVTGGSKGIGAAIARRLADEGCDVIVVARSASELDALADSIGAQSGRSITAIPADLSQHEEIVRLSDRVGDLDILVNCSGAVPAGNLSSVDDDRWRDAWDLKVSGYIRMSRIFMDRLRRQRGVIVNIVGTAGEKPDPNFIAGSSGNAALIAFTKALGREASRTGVRVVGINPGPVETDRIRTLLRARAANDLGDAERWPELMSAMPFGRAATPDEIADAAAFLASPRSAYTSGATLTIDGGA